MTTSCNSGGGARIIPQDAQRLLNPKTKDLRTSVLTNDVPGVSEKAAALYNMALAVLVKEAEAGNFYPEDAPGLGALDVLSTPIADRSWGQRAQVGMGRAPGYPLPDVGAMTAPGPKMTQWRPEMQKAPLVMATRGMWGLKPGEDYRPPKRTANPW